MKRDISAVLGVLASPVMAMAALAQEPPPLAGGNATQAVLEVNGEKIYAAEISMIAQNIAAQMSGPNEVEDEQRLMQMATQRVVEQTLLAQEARRNDLEPDEARLNEMVETVERQAGGREALEANLVPNGMSYDQFVDFLREMELSRRLIETQIIPTIKVSHEEVRAFYDENPQLFEAEEQVHARHIIFNASLTDDAGTVAEARAKADEARRRALAGEDFAELARELSEGPTAPKGGDLGFFTRAQTAPQFANAAFALEPGGISPVVRTEYGLHVIKVEEKRPPRHLPFEEVSEQVHGLLIQQKSGQRVGELVKSLGEQATVVTLVEPQPAGTSATEQTRE